MKLLLLIALIAIASAVQAAPKNELSVAAAIDSAYDSNVLNSRGPDFVNRIAPHAAWRLSSERFKLDAAYDLGYWTYALGKAENTVNHRARAGIEAHATRRLTINVDDEFTRAEDPGFLSRIGVVAPQIGILDNIAEGLLGYSLSKRWYGNLGYTFHHTSFDSYSAEQIAAGMAPLFDGDEHDALGMLAFRVTRLDDLRIGGRFQLFSAGPQSISAERWTMGASYSPTLGWRHQFFRQLEATADAGPLFYQRFAESSHVPGAATDGTTWRLGTHLRWFTDTWRGALSFTRDLVGATGVGSSLWADYLYAQMGYHYHERIDVSCGVGYFRNGRGPDQPVAYDGITADAIVDVAIVRYFRIGAYYQMRWQETSSGAVTPGEPVAQFPNVLRNIVGLRLLAVIGAESNPPRREVKE